MRTSLLHTLFRLHFISPRGIFRWMQCFASEGMTLMAILRFSAKYYPKQCAVVSDEMRLDYSELYHHARQLAQLLYAEYALRAGDSAGILCRNHTLSMLLLPALSRLGVNVRLLNTDLGARQNEEQLKKDKLKLLVYDENLSVKCLPQQLPCQAIGAEVLFKKLFEGPIPQVLTLPKISRGPEISVLTGGSSGNYKQASRRPSVTQFLYPFFALLQDVGISNYQSICIALPFYHGFGLSTLIVALLMGKKICLMRHFDTDQAMKMIREEGIEVLPIVPVMLARIWQHEDAAASLRSLRCILSGGDRLDRKLIDKTYRQLGDVLYNLYGTSEAGFFLLATPTDLMRHDETTLGRPIQGVRCEIRDQDNEGVGTLWVHSRWAMMGLKDRWQSTGDRVFCDNDGYYFHRGRADRMIVCGGENVYPDNVTRALSLHPDIVASHVYPVPHPEFGNVLNAQIELCKDSSLTPEDILQWLAPHVSRAEKPHHIIIVPIETLSTGKTAKNQTV